MTEETITVLCVDDEPEVLQGLKLNLRKHYRVLTAGGGREGLEMLEQQSPVGIVISDMRMPEMNGAEFLSLVRTRWPETVRILLTGYSEMNNAIRAINEGQIFRFLTKPFPAEQLLSVLEDASSQYRLIVAEKELLNNTLKGSINLMIELISLIDPAASGKYFGQKRLLSAFAKHIHYANAWEIEIAAVLSQIGLVTVPDEIRTKIEMGANLSNEEQEMISTVPQTSAKLITNIPRLSNVAEIVRYQKKNYDGSGYPSDEIKGENIPVGARVLRITNDYYDLFSQGMTSLDSFVELNNASREGFYDKKLLKAAIEAFVIGQTGFEKLEVEVQKLREGDRLVTPITNTNGNILVAKGVTINLPILEKLRQYISLSRINETVIIERPQ